MKHFVFWGLLSEVTCEDDSMAGLIPIFLLFSSSFLFLSVFSPLPAPILSMSSTDSLPLVADHQRQSALFCLSAIVYQHKNTNGQQAQNNQFLRGRSTVCLTSASLIIVSKRKPINRSRHLHLPTTKTLGIILKAPWFLKRSQPHRPQFGTWVLSCWKGDYLYGVEADSLKWSLQGKKCFGITNFLDRHVKLAFCQYSANLHCAALLMVMSNHFLIRMVFSWSTITWHDVTSFFLIFFPSSCQEGDGV